MRVLLADDQPRVRSAIRLFVEQQLIAPVVEEVTDTGELLDRIKGDPPHLLFLEWDLPGSNTEALLATLHRLYPQVYIIVLGSQTQTRYSALASGASVFVSLNDTPEYLLSALQKAQNSCLPEFAANLR